MVLSCFILLASIPVAAMESPAEKTKPATKYALPTVIANQRVVAAFGNFKMITDGAYFNMMGAFINKHPAIEQILDILGKKIDKQISLVSNQESLKKADQVIVFWILNRDDGYTFFDIRDALSPALKMAFKAQKKHVITITYRSDSQSALEAASNLVANGKLNDLYHISSSSHLVCQDNHELFDIDHNGKALEELAKAML